MLGFFIRHGLTPEEASSEGLLQIIAGSDTSASTIRAVIFHLLASASVYRNLQAEINTGIANGTISSPITDAEARRLLTVDLVFHYAKYKCLGQNVASREFNKVSVELLREFDFSTVKPQMAASMSNAGIWIMGSFFVRVTRRMT
ncbi:hypothetical protein G6011_05984 [Alternaria panax]|uniref:Uncharacterized protein n=1 Tax=Alternaria panax TaxID=48097 RepID=A0AAD4I975_9PLEO|nr:hypothetical protein G6011_05984 [Alternaria panax]